MTDAAAGQDTARSQVCVACVLPVHHLIAF